MLKIKPKKFKSFIQDYNRDIISGLVFYLPEIIISETDDTKGLVQRIIQHADANGVFKKTFVNPSNSNDVTDDDIKALCRHILLAFDFVTLRTPIYESFMSITPDGEFKPFEEEVPQVTIGWTSTDISLRSVIRYVDGSEDITGEWFYEQ